MDPSKIKISIRPRILVFRVIRPRIIKYWYYPEWEGLYKNYSHKIILQNLWKYQNLGYTVEDLLQEGWIVFGRCKQMYCVFDAKQFMALYKRSLHSQLYDIAIKSSKENNHVRCEDDIEELLVGKQHYSYNHGPLSVLINKAPKEVKDVLKFMFDAPAEFIENVVKQPAKNFLSNQELCKVLGYDSQKTNLLKIFKDYFKNTTSVTV